MTPSNPTAEVLIFRGVTHAYTYAIPQSLESSLQIGDQVIVPFGNSNCDALVIGIHSSTTTAPSTTALKPISQINAKLPRLSPFFCELIRWFSRYYLCSPYKAYQTIIGHRKLRETADIDTSKPTVSPSPVTLTPEQTHVISTIISANPPQEFLIHGVTASGKTEVYIHLITHVLNQGKSGIILLPEIALTPQFTQIFKTRFGDRIAVLHSGLTKKAQEIEWNKIYTHQVDIVLGPRSAIFAPFENLGVIIIDEEHEQSYKQDNHPRYLTHTIAQFRAKTQNAHLIYGSATPSIETTCRILKQNPKNILKMTQRVQQNPLPSVQVIDMKEEWQHQASILCHQLITKIQDRLDKKEKIIILLNRRGFSTHIQCGKCHRIVACPKCELSFTYHSDKRLRCHRCDITIPLPSACPSCQKNALKLSGTGTQKLETELQKLFPDAHVTRLDKDTVKTTKQLEKQLTEFQKSGDILIGTQLIAKGHHFPEVTLVGVLGIDTQLNMPDFFAPERTFQLLTQVAGRAGRGNIPGEVIIQSCQNEHYAIQHAITQNFDAFFQEEMSYRKELHYPPFQQLINILISSKNPTTVKKTSQSVFEKLAHHCQDISPNIQLLGPCPAAIEKMRDYYRWHILIKTPQKYLSAIKTGLDAIDKSNKAVRIILDFDPRGIL